MEFKNKKALSRAPKSQYQRTEYEENLSRDYCKRKDKIALINALNSSSILKCKNCGGLMHERS